MKIPDGHQAIMPYLIVENAEKLIDFAQQVFNANLNSKHLRDDGKTIMHAELQISGSTVMLAEATEQWKEHTATLFIYVDNADETFNKAIEAGAEVILELRNQEYGRSGGVADPCGNIWWITSIQ